MVGNDRIDTSIAQHGDLLAVGDPAINGDHQSKLFLYHTLDELLRQTVPIFTVTNFYLYRSRGKEGE